jgi:hypothetical protein
MQLKGSARVEYRAWRIPPWPGLSTPSLVPPDDLKQCQRPQYRRYNGNSIWPVHGPSITGIHQ